MASGQSVTQPDLFTGDVRGGVWWRAIQRELRGLTRARHGKTTRAMAIYHCQQLAHFARQLEDHLKRGGA